MDLDLLGRWRLPHFDLASLRIEGYLLLGCYFLVLLTVLYYRRGDLRRIRGRRWLPFLFFLALGVVLNNVVWLRFPPAETLPRPGLPAEAPAPSVPVLGAVPIFVNAALFGTAPALITGFVAGLVRGGLGSSRGFAPFELAAVSALIGFLLHQTYRGWDWRLLRRPIVAGLVGAGFHWTLLWMGVYGSTAGNGLSALDYTRSLLLASVGKVAVDCLLGGVLLQLLYAWVAGLRPSTAPAIVPPYLRSMHRRLLFALIPLTLVIILVLFSAVTTSAITESTSQLVDSMVQSASSAAEIVPLYFNIGQDLLNGLARDERLRRSEETVLQNVLQADLRTGIYGPFFSQLLLVDDNLELRGRYPQDDAEPELAAEEERLLRERTLRFGSPERTRLFATEAGHVISFMAPIEDERGEPIGALVGRSVPAASPAIDNLLAALKAPKDGEAGYVVDDRGTITFHPNDAYLLESAPIDWECAEISGLSETAMEGADGRACQDLDPQQGTRRLIYYLPVPAMGDWTVVVTYPYEAVLERATRISGQVLLILLVVTGVLAVAVPWLTSRLTRPLQMLANAARNITEGELDDQVRLTGEDEVGQLGRAFEQMRLSLKDRLEDLSLLLRVSQAVSSNLDVTQGIPTILEGALQATEARFARLILLDERGDPQVVMAHGRGSSQVTALDRAMARLGQRGGPVRIENVTRAKGVIDPQLVGADIKAFIAVPMRSQDHTVGVMWLGYDSVHHFTATEVDFLSTLTSQAAVAVENARLFQAAEGGRQRLSAILESTSDAVIVTDHADRLLLLNPAAAELLGTDSQSVSGEPVRRAIEEERVVHILTAPLDNGVPLTDEVPLPDGRTMFASASAIVGGDGQTIGRVAVLHDITYLKELDEMKSEFVATVSHDLRSPLTFMRGYATMIPMVGDVTAKQKTYVDKIMVGIEQMTEMIDDLLDLGRIEAGVGLMSEPCRLDDIIVTQVDTMQIQARSEGVTLRLDRTEDVTLVVGDAALLRRVISNLVDNAIKYTSRGGAIRVGWETRADCVLVWVADTGIGIAKADQVRLFEKFSRIKRRETVDIKGSGLGLAIVRSIVERHNGRVWVESELGQGSIFFVELPVGDV